MKSLKNIVALLLVLCMALSLCACGEPADDGVESTADTTASDSQQTEEVTDDGKAEYTVTVVDEGGNPVANAMVQICKDTCLPGVTNENGVAVFSVVEEEGYKVSFMTMPEGYTADAEEFYFESGSTEMTITLKAVA